MATLDTPSVLPKSELLQLYQDMLTPRLIEQRMLNLVRQGSASKWFSGIGQEAVSIGAASALIPTDWILPMHRNLGVFTYRCRPLSRLLLQLLGRVGGYTGGRDRSFHFGDLNSHVVGMISHLGAMWPVADGLALASKLNHSGQVALAICGDGTTSEGDIHEAMNLAAVWGLPVVFLIENNQWALSTPVTEQYKVDQLSLRATAYAMPGTTVDGNDLLAVRTAVTIAAQHARAGLGPSLIEAVTYRIRGHEESSSSNDYVDEAILVEAKSRDPIARYEQYLFQHRVLDQMDQSSIRCRVDTKISQAFDEALAAPLPSPDHEEARIYAPSSPLKHPPLLPASSSRSTRYVDAINQALTLAMEADPRVVLLGQDIAAYGGAFKVTAGLSDRFGTDRVRNTPIIESGAIGAALGLALAGYRPIVEMQFADFVSCGFNQIVNNLATTYYRWNAPVPVVIRLPVGGGTAAGPFHSQNPEAWFCHTPGLKVVAPSTPADAKALLLGALDDNNPVLFLEHKALYRQVSGLVPEGYVTAELGKARIVRPGRSATIVTWSAATHWALSLADELAAQNLGDIEVIDLATLSPLDTTTITESVNRTSRALVLHEAPAFAGFGAEVAAYIAEHCFEQLDAPVRRLGAIFTPVPAARTLEDAYSPKNQLRRVLTELLDY